MSQEDVFMFVESFEFLLCCFECYSLHVSVVDLLKCEAKEKNISTDEEGPSKHVDERENLVLCFSRTCGSLGFRNNNKFCLIFYKVSQILTLSFQQLKLERQNHIYEDCYFCL